MERYEGPLVAGMLFRKVTNVQGLPFGSEHVVTAIEASGGASAFRENWRPVRPVDDDREAWERFLPTTPLPNTGPKDFKSGQVWATRTDGSNEPHVWIAGDKMRILAGGRYMAVVSMMPHRDSEFAYKSVLLFDAPLAAGSKQAAPSKAHRQPSVVTPTCSLSWCGALSAAIDADPAAPALHHVLWNARDMRGYCSRACLNMALALPPRIPHATPAIVLDLVTTKPVAVCSACGWHFDPKDEPAWCTPNPGWRAEHDALIANSMSARELGVRGKVVG